MSATKANPGLASRWKGGSYDPHQTARMNQLQGVELASFGRRAGALGIDFLGTVAVFVVFALPLAYWSKVHNRDMHISFNPFENWYSTVLPVAYFGLLVWLTNGRTLGKWLLGLRIVSLAHQRIGVFHALERALGYGASLLEGGFGFVQYFTDPNRQTVHDRIAGTIVVRQKR